jgi:hypothetical protein
MIRFTRCLALLVGAVLAASSAIASDLEDRLELELRGAWGILEVEVYSACGGTYSDNTVGAAGVSSKAGYRFEPGELVKIDKIKVKRQRVDLLLTLAAQIRTSRMDGPFELFDERECRVQLIFPVPREQVKSGDAGALLDTVRTTITLWPSLADAQESDAWNGREIEALPDDYAETLQHHAVWKAEQTNAAIRIGVEHALATAANIADDLSDDPDFLAGFAEGAEKMSSLTLSDCSSLLAASYTVYHKNAPKERPKRWRDGWDDGQELVFNVLIANRLQGCFVPVPPVLAP